MPYARGKHASKPTGIPHRQHSTTKRASRHPVSWFPRFPPVTEDIICTIGPKSWDPEVLVKLMKALPKMLYNTTWIGWIWRTKFKDTKVAGLNPQKCAFISNFLWILPPSHALSGWHERDPLQHVSRRPWGAEHEAGQLGEGSDSQRWNPEDSEDTDFHHLQDQDGLYKYHQVSSSIIKYHQVSSSIQILGCCNFGPFPQIHGWGLSELMYWHTTLACCSPRLIAPTFVTVLMLRLL